MLSLAKITNNIVLTNPLSFNLPTFNNIIQKVSASNIERIFTTDPLLKRIGISQIKSWLSKIWYPKITENLLNTYTHKTQNYTLIFHLSQLSKNNITLSNFSQISIYPLTIPENSPLIYEILPTNPHSLITSSLKNNKILFVKQITTADNNYLLTME